MNRPLLPLGLLISLTCAVVSQADDASSANQAPRVPIALAWNEDGRLVVALRESRSLLLVNPEGWRIEEEWPLGVRPFSVERGEGGKLLVGGMDGDALVIEDGQVISQFDSGRGPTRLVALPEGQLATASLWDNRVRILDPDNGSTLAEHPLPFSPGELLPLPGDRLLVSDAYNGKVAVLNPIQQGSERFWALEGVNIRGLRLSERTGEVLFTEMIASNSGPLTRTNIDWGLALSAKLSAFRLALLDEPGDRLDTRRLTLDGSGHGAADPIALETSSDESCIYVASRGAHQVLLVDRTLGGPTSANHQPLGDSMRLKSQEVGRNPAAMRIDPSGRFLVTADAMSDTLTVLSTDSFERVTQVELSPADVSRSAEIRGEALFLDGRAAMDRWMSCDSCHPGGHTNNRSFDTLGDGSYGQPKSTPSLLGVADTAPYAWTGRFRTLEAQIDQSLRTSLHGPVPTADQIADLATYLRSLPPAPPLRDPEEPKVLQGAQVFRERRCDTCHVPPTYTSRPLRDPWPELESDGSLFSPPSLRGVARTAPYFHDGRAPTLEAALEIHHPRTTDSPWQPGEIEALVAFLESL